MPSNDPDILITAAKSLAGPVAPSYEDCNRLVRDLMAELTAERTGRAKLSEAYEETCEVIVERDHCEEVIGSLAADAGCTLEWSSGHEHGECIAEALAVYERELTKAREQIAAQAGNINLLQATIAAKDAELSQLRGVFPVVQSSDMRAGIVLCENCYGRGWYEGGPTLKTTCEKCGGTGAVRAESEGR